MQNSLWQAEFEWTAGKHAQNSFLIEFDIIDGGSRSEGVSLPIQHLQHPPGYTALLGRGQFINCLYLFKPAFRCAAGRQHLLSLPRP